MQKDKEEIPELLLLSAGEHWQQHLPGRGTGGYQWFFEVEGARDDVAEISIMPLIPQVRSAIGGEPPEAGSYDECLYIHALHAGTIILHLSQKRSWEKGKVPIRQYQIKIIVRDH